MIIQDIHSKKILRLTIQEIRQAPGAYCMSFGFDMKKIKQSIAAVGLLNPPLLVKGREGLMEIVTGYRRIMACRALNQDVIACCDLSPAGYADFDLLLLNFHDNRAIREFNPIEKGMVISRLLAYMPEEKIIRDYMPLLGLPSHAPTLRMFIQLETLDVAHRQGIVDQTISLPAAKTLCEMDRDSRSILMDWILHLHLNFNQQLQFLEWVIDLSIKEEIAIGSLLQEEPLQAVLNDRKMNLPQKAATLLESLRSRRYPRLTRAEKKHQKQIAGIAWPEGIRLQAPTHFESPSYRLTIEFQTGLGLKQKLATVSELKGLGKIQIPWGEETIP